MTITSVQSATFVADTVNYIRDRLKAQSFTGVGTRVYTSYPKVGVVYPMITIVDSGISQPMRLGMQSEGTVITLPLEIRIWAKDVKTRDELFDSVYNYLRTNQFSGSNIVGANLHDFKLNSAVNVSELGEEGIKSKVMEVSYLFICI